MKPDEVCDYADEFNRVQHQPAPDHPRGLVTAGPAGHDPNPHAADAPLRVRRGELAHRRDVRADGPPEATPEVAELLSALVDKHPHERV